MESHDVEITKVNEVYIKIDTEHSTGQFISDHFTFLFPGHTFVPAFRKRLWDGKIRLFNVMNRLLYGGLLHHLCKFLYLREYTVKFNSDFKTEKIDLFSSVLLPIVLLTVANSLMIRRFNEK